MCNLILDRFKFVLEKESTQFRVRLLDFTKWKIKRFCRQTEKQTCEARKEIVYVRRNLQTTAKLVELV
mgnify:CR=1 FL=1